MGQLARRRDTRGPGAWAAAAVLVACCALLAPAPARGAGVVGDGTAASCTEAAFTNALNGGGLVTFDCGPSSAVIFLSRSTTVAAGTTTIRGDGIMTLSGGNATRFFVVPEGADLVLEGLQLVNGFAAASALHGAVGGAVVVDGGSLSLTRVVISDSRTESPGTGGAIESANGAVIITDSALFGNEADSGGAIRASGAAPTLALVDTIVADNRARPGGAGGGLHVTGTVTIERGFISGNEASTGGGVLVSGGTTSVTDTVIARNAAGTGAGIWNAGTLKLVNAVLTENSTFEPILFVVQDGAALYNSPDGKATLDGVTVTENSLHPALVGPAAVIASPGALTVLKSIVTSNGGSGFDLGGAATITDSWIGLNDRYGVHAQGGPLQITRSTIAANGLSGLEAVGKPAAAIVNSTITRNTREGVSHGGVELILNSTIADNNPVGAGIAQVVTSEAVFKNTIVSGTEPNCALLAGGKHISDGFNLSSDASCGFTEAGDQAGTDPMLAPLAFNGGIAPTRALLPGSPAIDGATALGCPPSDQRGVIRPQGFACDVGAFEFGALLATVRLNGSAFFTGQLVSYEATTNPDARATSVDIYLGALLPDLVTFLSLVQTAPGVVSVQVGPAPVPFLASVRAEDQRVEYPYTFNGSEPSGMYFAYAALVKAGGDPREAADQLSLSVRPFEFSP